MVVTKCEAYQRSDQMYCDKCGLCWDMNDIDPPDCVNMMTGREQFEMMKGRVHATNAKEIDKFYSEQRVSPVPRQGVVYTCTDGDTLQVLLAREALRERKKQSSE